MKGLTQNETNKLDLFTIVNQTSDQILGKRPSILKKDKMITIDLILGILQVPEGNRNAQDIQKLAGFMRSVPYFSKLAIKYDANKINIIIDKICKKIKYNQINAGQALFKAGDRIDYFYIIFNGKFTSLIPKRYEQIEQEKIDQLKIRASNQGKKASLQLPLFLQQLINEQSNAQMINQRRQSKVFNLLQPLPNQKRGSTINQQDYNKQKQQGFADQTIVSDSNRNSHDQFMINLIQVEQTSTLHNQQLSRSNINKSAIIQQQEKKPNKIQKFQQVANNVIGNQIFLEIQNKSRKNSQNLSADSKINLDKNQNQSQTKQQKITSNLSRQNSGKSVNNTNGITTEQKCPLQIELEMCFGDIDLSLLENPAQYFNGSIFKFLFDTFIKSGESIGGHDIINSNIRKSTVIALKDSQIGYITKQEYSEILKEVEEEKFNKHVDVLCQSLNQNLTNIRKIIGQWVQYIKKMTFYKDQVAFKEGDAVQGCYIIRKGEFEISQYINLQTPQNLIEQQELKQQQLQKNLRPIKKKIIISIISEGQYFGEEDLIKNQNEFSSQSTCRSAKAKVYFINKYQFTKLLLMHGQVQDAFKKSVDQKIKFRQEKVKSFGQEINFNLQKNFAQSLSIATLAQPENVQEEKKIKKLTKSIKQLKGFYRDTFEKLETQYEIEKKQNNSSFFSSNDSIIFQDLNSSQDKEEINPPTNNMNTNRKNSKSVQKAQSQEQFNSSKKQLYNFVNRNAQSSSELPILNSHQQNLLFKHGNMLSVKQILEDKDETSQLNDNNIQKNMEKLSLQPITLDVLRQQQYLQHHKQQENQEDNKQSKNNQDKERKTRVGRSISHEIPQKPQKIQKNKLLRMKRSKSNQNPSDFITESIKEDKFLKCKYLKMLHPYQNKLNNNPENKSIVREYDLLKQLYHHLRSELMESYIQKMKLNGKKFEIKDEEGMQGEQIQMHPYSFREMFNAADTKLFRNSQIKTWQKRLYDQMNLEGYFHLCQKFENDEKDSINEQTNNKFSGQLKLINNDYQRVQAIKHDPNQKLILKTSNFREQLGKNNIREILLKKKYIPTAQSKTQFLTAPTETSENYNNLIISKEINNIRIDQSSNQFDLKSAQGKIECGNELMNVYKNYKNIKKRSESSKLFTQNNVNKFKIFDDYCIQKDSSIILEHNETRQQKKKQQDVIVVVNHMGRPQKYSFLNNNNK